MGYEYLQIKRDPRLVPWGSRSLTPEMQLRLRSIKPGLAPSNQDSRTIWVRERENRSLLAKTPLRVNSTQRQLKDGGKDFWWISNMGAVLALAGLITVLTVSSPAILSFGLTVGTLFAGAALVERRFGRRTVRDRKWS